MTPSLLAGVSALGLAAALAGSALAAPPVVASPTGPVGGQALERNLPPPPNESAPGIALPNIVPSSADATPIGPALRAIVLLGPKDQALAGPAGAGVDASRVPRMERHEGVLRRFIGQPISKKLIAQVEAAVAVAYRGEGYPFVRLSTPPQELTSGVLQVQVEEFTVGKTSTSGPDGAYVASRVRTKAGDEVNAQLLAQDLDWLNRYPFEQVTAVFTPSATPGETDLNLQTVRTKPWSAYVGYANSGSPLTGYDRYIIGAQTAIPGLKDAFASYQYTGSDDALFYNHAPFVAAPDPKYDSQAGRIVIPTLARQDFEFNLDYIQTYAPVGQGLFTRLTTVEADGAYRAALSDFLSYLPGEMVIGASGKSEMSHTLFAGQAVAQQAITVFEGNFGWSFQGNDYLGRTVADLTVHVSPGGIGNRNSAAAYTAFSAGRFTSDQFAYASGDLTRLTRLPTLFGLKNFTLVNVVIAQYAGTALPLTEQAGLGGPTLVRGYTLDDGAFDSAIVSRNELHGPPIAFIYPDSAFSPYIFFDYGHGYDHFDHLNATAESTGVAVDIQLGPHISATFDSAFALNDAGFTRTGTVMIDSRVTFSF